jgi:hypothetical protein
MIVKKAHRIIVAGFQSFEGKKVLLAIDVVLSQLTPLLLLSKLSTTATGPY